MLKDILALIRRTTPRSFGDLFKPYGEILTEDDESIMIRYQVKIFVGNYITGLMENKIVDGMNKIVNSSLPYKSISVKLLPGDPKYSSVLDVNIHYSKKDIITLSDRVTRPSMRTLLGLN